MDQLSDNHSKIDLAREHLLGSVERYRKATEEKTKKILCDQGIKSVGELLTHCSNARYHVARVVAKRRADTYATCRTAYAIAILMYLISSHLISSHLISSHLKCLVGSAVVLTATLSDRAVPVTC